MNAFFKVPAPSKDQPRPTKHGMTRGGVSFVPFQAVRLKNYVAIGENTFVRKRG